MRYSVVKVLYDMKSEHLPWITHAVTTLVLLGIITAVVVGLLAAGVGSGTAFNVILDITGGIGGSLATFMLPAAIFLKVAEKSFWLYNVAIGVFIVGFIFMIIVLVETCISLA
jgi:hypothetical protein